jgi:ribosomal protein S7
VETNINNNVGSEDGKKSTQSSIVYNAASLTGALTKSEVNTKTISDAETKTSNNIVNNITAENTGKAQSSNNIVSTS